MSAPDTETETLTFPLHYFDKLKKFKSVVQRLKEEKTQLICETRVLFAIEKHNSIRNMMARNKELSRNEAKIETKSEAYPIFTMSIGQLRTETHNEKYVIIPRNLNCKAKMLYTCGLTNSVLNHTSVLPHKHVTTAPVAIALALTMRANRTNLVCPCMTKICILTTSL